MGGRILADGMDRSPLKPLAQPRCHARSTSRTLEYQARVYGSALLFDFFWCGDDQRITASEMMLFQRILSPCPEHLTFCGRLHLIAFLSGYPRRQTGAGRPPCAQEKKRQTSLAAARRRERCGQGGDANLHRIGAPMRRNGCMAQCSVASVVVESMPNAL
jgi:hypothetical protein